MVYITYMIKMDNNIFKAMGSTTRLHMLQLLTENEMHISGLAKELNISVPVAAKHVRILEDADLIERKEFGKTHIIKIKTTNIYTSLDRFAKVHDVEIQKGSNLLDALQKISAIEVKRVGDHEFIISTNGEKGFYLYEIDGKPSHKTVNEYLLEENVTVEWKKLTPITIKKISIKIKE
jgi:predicted transcriptional regulator